MVSVLIPTKNEERNIEDCLGSVAWSDDVVVVDSQSTDRTRSIAVANGASVVDFTWNGNFPKKKNWALANVAWKYEWVLILDADERITTQLGEEIQSAARLDTADGYFINRRFIFLGKWIRHCGYYPSWNLRLFKHRLGRYEKLHVGDTGSGDNEVHEHVELNGKAAYLRHDMLHYAYPDVYTWMEKHNRYSNWEAEIEVRGAAGGGHASDIGETQRKRRRLREFSRHLPGRPLLRFLFSYVLQRGFLDGKEGFIFCRLLGMYEALSVYKAYELRQKIGKHSTGPETSPQASLPLS